MTEFLKQVAAHYYEGPEIEHTCFVFPNRRSLVFFKKYLGGLVRERPLVAPPMYTINDFFYRVYNVDTTDKLRLLLELYDCYKALNPEAEPLDEFIFWGDVMLSDFDDIDKYLVDAAGLLRNVSEFKSIQDSYEYLSETQSEAIDRFLSHFKDAKTLENGVKGRFVKLWNILYPLYESFNKRLKEKGMAYEGMVYRSLATALKKDTSVKDLLDPVFPGVTRYVFVGLNALNECEKTLLRRMRDAQLAEFVWDYVSPMIKDPANKSSFFMKKNVEDFPQAFPIDPEGLPQPKITVVQVPSSVGQAKLAPWILSQTSGDPVETAFVLPDESLLLPLLNSIPSTYDNVNVTMGYPMSGSAVYTLLESLGTLQLKLRKKADDWYFYHAPVREIFSSGLFRELLNEDEKLVVDKVKAAAKYYIPMKDLLGGPVLDLFFKPVIEDVKAVSAEQNHRIEEYFSEIVGLIGRTLTGNSKMLLEVDFAKRCHTQLNILQETDLEILPATHLRVLERILQGISVPFRGEPLKGLQVMGPLETRALDFNNLVILSANEGMFPRRSVSSSFIPPELRKGFGLPTYEFQDAVWAYYFYRMIQRPAHVWLIYDSRTEGLKTGEESRYIKQLEYHFKMPLERLSSEAPLQPPTSEGDVPKCQEDVDIIKSKLLSASSLKSYLDCEAKFYYQVVKGLKSEDEIAESLDSRMLGNVFHHVMEALYSRSPIMSADIIKSIKADVPSLKVLIRDKIIEEMHSIEVTGRNLVLEEVILDYVISTLNHDLALLDAEKGSKGFKIVGLEKHLYGELEGFKIHGFADRMDSYRDGELRIIDYKTGKVEDKDVNINDDNADEVCAALFGDRNEHRPKIALQMFIYDLMAHQNKDLKNYRIVNAIYSTGKLYTGALPEVPESPAFGQAVSESLKDMLDQMSDLSVPFRRTQEKKTCDICDVKDICGR